MNYLDGPDTSRDELIAQAEELGCYGDLEEQLDFLINRNAKYLEDLEETYD